MPRPLLPRWVVLSALAAACHLAAAGRGVADSRDFAAAVGQCKKASDKEEVIASCSIVIAQSHDPRLLERAYNRRGMANEATAQFDGAVRDYSQVIRLDPKIAGYFDNRMRAYKALGQLDLALKDADTAVAMAPTYPFVFHGRGAVRFDRGEYLLAVQDFGSALALNRSDAPLLVDRGRALMKLGHADDAIRDFSEAHEVDAAFMPALRERGLAWASLGNGDLARSDLEPVVVANPNDDEAASALRALDGGSSASPPRVADADEPSPAVKRAEEEARQKLQERQDAEKAREEAALRLKEERLARARSVAQQVRGDASDFIKANRDDPQLMDHLQRITDLGTAITGVEPGPIERGTSLLSAGLAADPVYVAFAERRKSERARDDERTLADALTTLRVQRRFLVGEVVKDPTGDGAPGFLALAKQADAVLTAPDLATAQTVMGGIDAAIAKARMTDRYEVERQAAAAEARDKGSVGKPVP